MFLFLIDVSKAGVTAEVGGEVATLGPTQAGVSKTQWKIQSPCGQNGETWAEQPQLNGGFVVVVKTAGQYAPCTIDCSTLF